MGKVLIVEDDPNVASLYREKLQLGGFSVDVAGDGSEGLRKALEDSPTVVLLDMHLPDMDGTTVLKRLRADPRGKEVPVIILTNDVESERLSEVKDLYSDYLLKVDLALDDLVEKVRSYA